MSMCGVCGCIVLHCTVCLIALGLSVCTVNGGEPLAEAWAVSGAAWWLFARYCYSFPTVIPGMWAVTLLEMLFVIK